MMLKKACLVCLCCIFLAALSGCETMARKFTRKSKKSGQPVQMVLAPEEYKGPEMSKEELYRQYFLFWKSWHDELENALIQRSSVKKKVSCGQEALKNLINMKSMLTSDMQKNLEIYINRMIRLLADIKSDIYGAGDFRLLQTAERIKMDVHRDFVYPRIKNYLK